MRVVSLHRYPIKSMQGQSLPTATVGAFGIDGDRSHALMDVESGVVLTARLDPSLLFARGAIDDDGTATVTLADGTVTVDHGELSAWIGRPVELVASQARPSTYEIRIDPEDETSDIVAWQGPGGSFHDSTRTQISVVATGDIERWDVRRFRPNVVVEGESVDHLVGHRVRLAGVEVDVTKTIDRCVMITRPQPDGIDRDLEVLRTVRRERDMQLGVGAMVLLGGSVAIGDCLEVIDA